MLTVRVVDVRPAFTVTEAGTVKFAFVLLSMTTAFPAGAALVSVIVQVEEALDPKLAGQVSDDTRTGAIKLMLVLAELEPYEAVIVAL